MSEPRIREYMKVRSIKILKEEKEEISDNRREKHEGQEWHDGERGKEKEYTWKRRKDKGVNEEP